MIEMEGEVEQKGDELENMNRMDIETEEEVKDERGHEHDEEEENQGSPSRPKSAPLRGTVSRFHAQLSEALSASPLLQAVHVHVRNNSYWYRSRHSLGPKRQAACLVKQDSSMRWESAIYKLKPRESDGEMVPTRTFLSSHKSRWAAYRKCEAAQKERDADPWASVPDGDPDKILSTHFHVLVVSQMFDRQSPSTRLVTVYEALLQQMGEQLHPTDATRAENAYSGSYGMNKHAARRPDGTVPGPRVNAAGLGVCPPTRLGLGSTYGAHMCNLDVFRVLFPSASSSQGIHLYFECRTPSQWHPEEFIAPPSERYGASHLGFLASTVPAQMQGAANKSRLRLLAHVQSAQDRFGAPPAAAGAGAGAGAVSQGSLLSLAETLGVDPIVSGAKYKRSGGVYGHFFSDLPREVKQMIMDKFVENKKLIQREGNRKVDPEGKKQPKKKKDTFQPKTGMSMLRAKIAGQLEMAEYDAGTHSESEMMEEVYIAARKFERVAHRLQRIRRGSVLRKAIKCIWWRRWAAVNIQRVVRGRYSRMYTALLARLRPRAVVPLQRRFRNRRSWRLVVRWQAMTLRMTRVIWPKMKKFLRNCFLNLTWKLTSSTVIIQTVCRMYIQKVRFVRMKEERRLFADPLSFILPYHKAAIAMQRRFRGNIGRRGYSDRIEAMLVRRIDWPRAILIQKIYRGLLGRRRAKQARYKLECLLLLQRVCKAYVRRVWDAQLARARLEMHSATAIQCIVRGRIDRVLVGYYAREAFHTRKFMPAVIRVQRVIRGWHARRFVGALKRRIAGAKAMQGAYRRYQARLEFWRRWREARERFLFLMAQTIQKLVRRFLCTKRLPTLLLMERGRKLMAAKVILRAWVNFKYAKRMQLLLDDNRSSFYQKKLPRFKEALDEIHQDQTEIKGDIRYTAANIERLKSRLKEVDGFVVEAQMRSAQVEKELTGLTPEDFERGWGDAFGEEFSVLSRQLRMAGEEIRCLKAALLKHNAELRLLYCELEEVEIELDHICVLQTEAFEGWRRACVGRIERRVQDSKKRQIRIERCKWKTEAVRRNVILRQRESYQRMIKLNQDAREFNYARTISYEVRRQRQDFEDLQRRAWLKQDTAALARLNTTYEVYAAPVQETFDSVVRTSLSLLRDITLEQRAEILKERFRNAEKTKKKLKGGQFSALKTMDLDDVRNIKLG